METMTNMHNLAPCRLCPDRMAVPGEVVCTVCSAVSREASLNGDGSTTGHRFSPITIPTMVEEVTR